MVTLLSVAKLILSEFSQDPTINDSARYDLSFSSKVYWSYSELQLLAKVESMISRTPALP